MSTRPQTAAGFSLIEVLVALVVLSIGMIGIAAMQVEGLRFGQQAIVSTRAIGLAADMADRIRANPGAQVTAGILAPGDAYAVDADAPGPAPALECADTATSSIDLASVCAPAALAAYDIWQWKTALQGAAGSGLPGGEGEIVYSFNNGVARFEINVTWQERGEDRIYQLLVQQ